MKICPYCRSEIPEESRFCPGCGSRLEPVYEEAVYQETYDGDTEAEASTDYRNEGDPDAWDYSDEEKDEEIREEPVRKYRRKTAEEEEEEYYREGRKTVIVGVTLAILICVIGIALYIVVTNMLNKEPEIEVGTDLSNKPMQVTVTPERETEDETDKEHALPGEEDQEPEEEPEEAEDGEITATVTTVGQEAFYAYNQARVTGSTESSVLEDGGVYHVSAHMVDSRTDTSWQEGSSGDGTGDWVLVQFDQSYGVKYISFKLGNWKSESLFYANNRPQRLLITLGEKQFDVSFQDGMREQTVELSEECEASEIMIQVLGVYNGSEWSDCCITEMSVWGS